MLNPTPKHLLLNQRKLCFQNKTKQNALLYTQYIWNKYKDIDIVFKTTYFEYDWTQGQRSFLNLVDVPARCPVRDDSATSATEVPFLVGIGMSIGRSLGFKSIVNLQLIAKKRLIFS